MALETLKGVTHIDGFEVVRMDAFPGPEIKPDSGVFINDSTNTIGFKIQNGPIKEKGANGCQIDTIIMAAKGIIEGLDDKFPCKENKGAIKHLDGALIFLKARKFNREKRGVEGTSNK